MVGFALCRTVELHCTLNAEHLRCKQWVRSRGRTLQCFFQLPDVLTHLMYLCMKLLRVGKNKPVVECQIRSLRYDSGNESFTLCPFRRPEHLQLLVRNILGWKYESDAPSGHMSLTPRFLHDPLGIMVRPTTPADIELSAHHGKVRSHCEQGKD